MNLGPKQKNNKKNKKNNMGNPFSTFAVLVKRFTATKSCDGDSSPSACGSKGCPLSNPQRFMTVQGLAGSSLKLQHFALEQINYVEKQWFCLGWNQQALRGSGFSWISPFLG